MRSTGKHDDQIVRPPANRAHDLGVDSLSISRASQHNTLARKCPLDRGRRLGCRPNGRRKLVMPDAHDPDVSTEPSLPPEGGEPGSRKDEKKDTATTPSTLTEASAVELLRATLGREVVAVALLVVLGAFRISVVEIRDAAGITTAMGTVTTLIGTLVGTYFGVQVGGQGRAEDAAARNTANEVAV